MQTEVKKLPKSTLELKITVPAEDVGKVWKQTLESLREKVEIKGFRKGNAPLDLLEKSLDQSKVKEEVLNELLKKYYVEALKENKISAIGDPKVDVEGLEKDKDFVFTATVAVKPSVKLKDYKQTLKEKAKEKKQKAQKDKEEALKSGKPLDQIHDHLHTDEIINAIAEATEVEISDLLIEDEVNRYMTRLLNQLQTLGMEVEDYLKAQRKEPEQLRGEFSQMAENNLKAEFGMAEAIIQEKIQVSDEDIENFIKASGDEKTAEEAKKPEVKWYLRSILEKNRLLEKIMEELGMGPEETEEKKGDQNA